MQSTLLLQVVHDIIQEENLVTLAIYKDINILANRTYH